MVFLILNPQQKYTVIANFYIYKSLL